MRHILIKEHLRRELKEMKESYFMDHWGESMPGTGDLNGKPTEETRLFIKQQRSRFLWFYLFLLCVFQCGG